MKIKIVLNSLSSVLLQMVNIIANLIVPWIIINEYGSEINGLVQSITQFLAIISFAELGVGAVIQSALYVPITNKDYCEVSRILSTGSHYFKRIALFLIGYIILLVIVYPALSGKTFSFLFSGILIVSIAISSFAQYYFGLIRTVFLNADLRGYIHSFLQIGVLVINIFATVFLVNQGCSIHLVKLVSSGIFLVRPILLSLYIKKHYPISFNEAPQKESVPQMWNGVAQHVSAVVLEQTDVIVLTLFSTLKSVSIYSVYHLVVYGVRALYNSLTVGLQSAFGRLWAEGNKEKINDAFSCLEVGCHFLTIFLYCCTGKLILPFIEIYTKDVGDVSYINTTFAILITIAVGCQCLRTPYNILILSSGHFKQTQKCYIVASVINILISVILVNLLGLIGVAIGTLCALAYQTVWMAAYDYKNLVNRNLRMFFKQIIIDGITVVIIIYAIKGFVLTSLNYFGWLLLAIKTGTVVFGITLVMAGAFYWKEVCVIASLKNK